MIFISGSQISKPGHCKTANQGVLWGDAWIHCFWSVSRCRLKNFLHTVNIRKIARMECLHLRQLSSEKEVKAGVTCENIGRIELH